MKRFLLKLALFCFIILLLDLIFGKSFAYMVDHARGGNNARNNYICNLTNEDILIFGSSRAVHHYNPMILSDSLGMTCYNCGQDGNGAILNYGRYQLICQRYHPCLLIYDFQYDKDAFSKEDNHQFLGWLRPYYNRPGISEIFKAVDDTEKYKMISRLYQYNSRFLNIIMDYAYPVKSMGINGYLPANIDFDSMKVADRDVLLPIDSLKIGFIRKMIEMSGDTPIVFTVSPYYNGIDTTLISPIADICKEMGLPLIDFSNHPKYLNQNKYFADGSHLNAVGADEYTKDIVRELKYRQLIP